MGQSQHSAFHAWFRWLTARTKFEEQHHIRDLPDETTPEKSRRWTESLSNL